MFISAGHTPETLARKAGNNTIADYLGRVSNGRASRPLAKHLPTALHNEVEAAMQSYKASIEAAAVKAGAQPNIAAAAAAAVPLRSTIKVNTTTPAVSRGNSNNSNTMPPGPIAEAALNEPTDPAVKKVTKAAVKKIAKNASRRGWEGAGSQGTELVKGVRVFRALAIVTQVRCHRFCNRFSSCSVLGSCLLQQLSTVCTSGLTFN